MCLERAEAGARARGPSLHVPGGGLERGLGGIERGADKAGDREGDCREGGGMGNVGRDVSTELELRAKSIGADKNQ